MPLCRYFAYFLVASFLGISGCTPHTDPMKGWRDLGEYSSLPVPDAIKQDAAVWFKSMPTVPQPGDGADDGLIGYLEDGTGQHAVVVEDPHDGERWHYALIYDRDNHRIKVLKYSVGSYQS